MPDLKDKYSDNELNPADFEREFAGAGSPGFDQAKAEMDEANQNSKTPEELKAEEEAGNQSGGWTYENQARSASSGTNNTATSFVSKVGGPEAAAAFTALSAVKSIFWGSKKRKRATAGAAVAGTLTGGALLMLTFISGPLELVHLAQTLEKGFSSAEHISSIRGSKLLRWAKPQDTGETRLGSLGRQYVRGTIAELSDKGINFVTNENTNLNGVEIDMNKLAESYPELNSMSPNEKAAWLSDKLGVPNIKPPTTSDVLIGSGDSTYSVDLSSAPLKLASSLLSNVIGSFGDGGALSTAMKGRLMAKYFDIASLFHPLKRLSSEAQKKIANTAEARQAEEQAQSEEITPIEDQATPEVNAVKDELSGPKAAFEKSLFLTGGLCALRSAGQDIGIINRLRVVIPSVIMALRLIAIGSQIESGQGFSASQEEGVLAGLTNNQTGQDVFGGEAMQVLEGVPSATSGSTDILPMYKQAFATGEKSSGYVLKSYTGKALSFVPGGAGFACNNLVQWGGAVFQLGLVAFESGADVATGGALTPVEAATIGGLELAKQIPSFVGSAIIMNFVSNFIVHSNTAHKLALDAFSGAGGGNLLAYGARTGGNMLADASGAVQMAGSAIQPLAYSQQQQAKQQFESQNFFARLFNIHDYRSLVGRLATSLSPSFRQNLMSFASSIGNFGNVIGSIANNLFAAIFPHASAAAVTQYDWGFPQTGIPDSLLNSPDPTMNDPYWNACKLFSCQKFTDPLTNKTISVDGDLANLKGQQTTDFNTYNNYALTCFGDTLEQEGGQWAAVPTKQVDETSSSYISDCTGNRAGGDQIFQRLMLFVADSTTMDPMACASGNGQACTDINYTGG